MENKIKHSPIPWKDAGPEDKYSVIVDAHGGTVVSDEEHGMMIAFICEEDKQFAIYACNNIERVENERHELLEALKSFLRCPSVGSAGPGSVNITVQDFNMKAANAAIAKAEGR